MLVKQAVNVLELLEFFAERRRPATMAEIAAELQWPRSSTFNLIGTLAEKGYLFEPVARGGYYPSPRWMLAVQAFNDAAPLPQRLLQAVTEIRDQTGETTCVAAPSGVCAIMLHVLESPQPVRYYAATGSRVPIQASSVGRALLAGFTPTEREALYRRIAFSPSPATAPQDGAAVEAALSAATARGYHQSDSEYVPDLAGVAMPVILDDWRLSLVVAGPRSRCLERRAEIAETIRAVLQRHEM
ncbi:helix-turn-helix domain-containing protein [Gemmobacter sp. 24YEA27]|uniref:IclR family transcriptional regulator n=1 Tax=Gemmobacter sp. 24YEA27 TaxID=3040672 RepID=UPI0024B3C424|nr:helix-turn-helix domain-containing protein [Gemmobacter sp. 24YEA27]